MRKIFLITVILVLGAHGTSVQGATEIPIQNLLTIHQLNQQNPKFGTYHVEGYVIRIYTCPPCPKGALCKPCAPEHIILSDENKSLGTVDDITDQELAIITDTVQPFEIGKKYRVLLQILDVKTLEQKLNNPKLIYFEGIK